MSAKRGDSGLAGVLLVDKPSGCTSHDVVNRVRRATGERRVGHAGTLDPGATGLLVVLVGPYTRLEPYLSAAQKCYEATIVFGSETDTDDAEGTVVSACPVPDSALDESFARKTLASFLGESSQRPPSYSAIKLGGQVAHRVARGGGSLDIPPRPINVAAADLLRIQNGEAPSWVVSFAVSKGTYIRALARDIGRAIGSSAHLGALRRTAAGAASVTEAKTLEDIERARAAGEITSLFSHPTDLLDLEVVHADAHAVLCGRPLPAPNVSPERVAVVSEGVLLAIYRLKDDQLVPEAVFPVLHGACQ